MKELLPQQFFVRIHRSLIVAIKYIETVKKNCVIIDGKIPINSNYKEGYLTITDDLIKKIDNEI